MMRSELVAISRMMTRILPLLMASGLCLMITPAQAEPDPAKERRILVLGDSLTKGYGLLPEEAFPALLEKLAEAESVDNLKVRNGGVSGDTTAGGLRRMKWLLKRRVDVLVIALGGNDGLRGIAPEETAKNLQAIIDTARESNSGMKLILAGMEMPDNMGEAYVKAYRETFLTIAKQNKIPLIPLLLEGVGGVPALNQPDQIHPNADGQKKVAATVWKALKPVLTAEPSVAPAP